MFSQNILDNLAIIILYKFAINRHL